MPLYKKSYFRFTRNNAYHEPYYQNDYHRHCRRSRIFQEWFPEYYSKRKKTAFKFIGEASDGIGLLEQVRQHRPDIVITDIMMPKMDGVQACRSIKQQYPVTAIIALSMFNEANQIIDMINAGASGYLEKSSSKEEITTAIETVSKGMPYYSGGIPDNLLRLEITPKPSHQEIKKPIFTGQEIKVIRMICEQLTTKEIAAALRLSIRTIEDYRHHIQEKMGAKNMVGIAVYALVNEIIRLVEL